MSLFTRPKEILFDILFPPLCILCKNVLILCEKENTLCIQCIRVIQLHSTFLCPVCGARLADNKKICHKNSSYRLLAATSYAQKEIQNLIWTLKYEYKTVAAKPLAYFINQYLELVKVDIANYLLIPMPLHRSRKRERGFNQVELIAKHIAQTHRISIDTNILKRIKSTKRQAELKDFEKRKENVKNTFAIDTANKIAGKNILLLDDVFTSGATMNEAVRVLKNAHVNRIIALVVAKAG
jgi:competence protein ComFC